MSNEIPYLIEEERSKEDIEKIIEDLGDQVDKLYSFRDHYFEEHPVEEARNKDEDIKRKLESTMSSFDAFQDAHLAGPPKARYLYLKGRALNVTPKYDSSAAQCLSKAVKLDPGLVDAWNELGECYWKDNNISEAKNCFDGALPHRRNKISLRNMSIILRQEPNLNAQERQQSIEKSVELAKEAVRLDPKDGISWSLLGNAYLCSFFTLAQDPAVLKLCMSAYRQAGNDPVARGQADLHYNHAVAFKYEEEYLNALESYGRASSLDPTWTDPSTEKQKLITYLDTISEYVRTRGKTKEKKIQQMIQQLDSKQLGPYSDGQYSVKNQSVKLDLVPLLRLKEGVNPETVVLGKVVCSVRNENVVPFTFCLIDSEATCFVVTLYNLADGKGVIIGDSIAIPEPYVTKHSFKYSDKEYDFFSIRVDNPMVMIINGKKVGKNLIAGTRIVSSTHHN